MELLTPNPIRMKTIYLILIVIACSIPSNVYALDQMRDSELGNITGQFGTTAAAAAGDLSTPPADAAGNVQNFTPAAEPASVANHVYTRVTEIRDMSSDASGLGRTVTDTRDTISSSLLGFF